MTVRRSRVLRVHMGVVFAFLYLPIVVLVVLSFNASGLPTVWEGFSLQWYRELVGDEELIAAIKNSLIVAGFVTAISTVLGTLLAIGLLSFFNLLRFTLGLQTIVIAHVVFDMIFVAAIVRTRLGYFDRRIEEAAAGLGANPVTTFLLVTLPAILPGVVAGALVAFTLSIDEFVIAFFNSGPTSITFLIKVYSMIRFGVTPVINAVAAIVMMVSLLTMLIALRLTRPKGETSTELGVGVGA